MNPQRIVSLLPSATEILFALGAGERVVGVTHECDYPPEARSRPHLTSSTLPDDLQTHPGADPPPVERRSEKIDRHVRSGVHAGSSLYALDEALLERLAPDLIVTQELCPVCAVSYELVEQAVRRLRGDPRIVSLEPSSYPDVLATIETLGDLTGTASAARRLLSEMRGRTDALGPRDGATSPRTLVLEWTDPVMSAGHWIPELIDIAGGVPVLGSPGGDARAIDIDEATSAAPEVIIAAPCGYDLERTREAVRELEANDGWRALLRSPSVRLYAMDGSAYVNRPGPRLVDTAELFASAIRDEGDAPGVLVRM